MNFIRIFLFFLLKKTNKPQYIFGSFLRNFQNNHSNNNNIININNNNNNELEIKTQTQSQSQTNNKGSIKNKYSGIDERYPHNDIDMEKQIEKEKEELLTISINMKKLELLKKLQNEKISQLDKIKFIEEYEKYDFDEIINKIQSKTKYRPDILDEIYMYDF